MFTCRCLCLLRVEYNDGVASIPCCRTHSLLQLSIQVYKTFFTLHSADIRSSRRVAPTYASVLRVANLRSPRFKPQVPIPSTRSSPCCLSPFPIERQYVALACIGQNCVHTVFFNCKMVSMPPPRSPPPCLPPKLPLEVPA